MNHTHRGQLRPLQPGKESAPACFLRIRIGAGLAEPHRKKPQTIDDSAGFFGDPRATAGNGTDSHRKDQTHPRILVIGADSGATSQLCQILQAWGTITYRATTREQAETLLSMQPYRLILASLASPEIDTIGLIRELRESGPNTLTPVVAMAARARAEDAKAALRVGANDVLPALGSVRGIARVCLYWLVPGR